MPDPADLNAPVALRPVQLEDWPRIHEWSQRPDVTQYQAWGPNTAAETRSFVEAAVLAASDRPQKRHALTIVAGDLVVGLIEVTIRDSPEGVAEFGYAVHPDHWGQGLATEAARAVADWTFANTDVAHLIAFTHPQNYGSQRVLERVGMTRLADRDMGFAELSAYFEMPRP